MQNNWKLSEKDNYNKSIEREREKERERDNKMPASSGLYRIKHGRVLGLQKTSTFIFIAYIAACSTCGKYEKPTHTHTHTQLCVYFDAFLNKKK